MASPRRRLWVVMIGAGCGLFLLLLPIWQSGNRGKPASAGKPATPLGPTSGAPETSRAASPVPTRHPEDVDAFDGIERLNAPGFTVQDDLTLLSDLLRSWQTLFPHQGNPWGENRDITASLTGNNPRSIALLPRRLPAINAAGELVDRWGTPYFFHQLSGTSMEIRSAGPDRVLHTRDDVVLTP
ncbi:MAG: hypothetical protein U1F61_05255 [Opitutaceae bacterium]